MHRNPPFGTSRNTLKMFSKPALKVASYSSVSNETCFAISMLRVSASPRLLTSPMVPVRRSCSHFFSRMGTVVLRTLGHFSPWRSALRFAPTQKVCSMVPLSSPWRKWYVNTCLYLDLHALTHFIVCIYLLQETNDSFKRKCPLSMYRAKLCQEGSDVEAYMVVWMEFDIRI